MTSFMHFYPDHQKGRGNLDHIINVPEIFGSDVFSQATMKKRLAPEVYEAWKSCIAGGSHLPLEVAQPIAEAMKEWEIGRASCRERV